MTVRDPDLPPPSGEATRWYRKHQSLTAAGLVFCLAWGGLLLGMDRTLSLYDEGLILTGAMRVAQGAAIHRDFYANYGPGQFYVLSLIFELFGPTVLAERLWDALLKASIAACLAVIALRLMSRTAAAIVTALSLLWLTALATPGYPIWPALLLSLIASLALLPVFEGKKSTSRLIAAGVAVGMAVLFRYEVGFIIFAGTSAALLAYSAAGTRGTRYREALGLLRPFWGGIALVCIPLAFLYFKAGLLPDFLFQVVTFPSRHYAATRSLPFPLPGATADLFDLIVYLPVFAIPGALLGLYDVTVRTTGAGATGTRSSWTWSVALLVSLACATLFKGLVRVSPIHMSLSLFPSLLVLGAMTDRHWKNRASPEQRAPSRVFLLTAIVVTTVSSMGAAQQAVRPALKNLEAVFNGQREASGHPQGSLPPLDSRRTMADLKRERFFILSEDMAQAIRFIRTHTDPDEFIFVGTGRHDKIFANNVAFYFIADRRPATKWYHFDPALQNSQPVQEKMISELAAVSPRFVVLDSEFDKSDEPNQSSQSSNVRLLDRFIAKNYASVVEYGYFNILKRKF